MKTKRAMDSGTEESYMATSLKIDDAPKGRFQQLASQRRRSPHSIMLEAIQQ